MSIKSNLIYDTDGGGWQGNQQTFTVDKNKSVLLQSAGLVDDVTVYQMVSSTCVGCAPKDILWEQVVIDGVPITLGPKNNQTFVTVPGKYSLGDPESPPVFTGDVNISLSRFQGLDVSSLGKLSNPPVNQPVGWFTDLDTNTLVYGYSDSISGNTIYYDSPLPTGFEVVSQPTNVGPPTLPPPLPFIEYSSSTVFYEGSYSNADLFAITGGTVLLSIDIDVYEGFPPVAVSKDGGSRSVLSGGSLNFSVSDPAASQSLTQTTITVPMGGEVVLSWKTR